MFNFCKINKNFKCLITASLLVITAFAHAKKADNVISSVLSVIPTTLEQPSKNNFKNSAPNSSVVLDFSFAEGESWDIKDSSNNVISNCINGTAITGFEYTNVTISTVGGSFFSEAVLYFSDSNNGDDGLQLTTGAGDESSGIKSFSSNGILDLTDNGLDDIVSLNDGVFLIQLFEKIDDVANAIDARYTSGTISVWGVDLVAAKDDCPFLMKEGQPNTDLSVSYSSNQQGPQSLNDIIEFNILVSNNTENPAINVSLTNTLSNKLSFNQLTCSDGTTTTNSNSLSSINVQNIAGNSSLSCSIQASIIAYGTIENTVSASADNDSNANNNSAFVIVNGAFRVVPVNNYFALLLLILGLVFLARKRINLS
jgi:uncharacterized repeat protein (TIGR01451 family)